MSLSLSGKVAIVSGASRGIGAAIAKCLASDGASVVINYYHSAVVANKLTDEINAAEQGEAVAIQADMSSVTDATRLIEESIRRFGRLDILVLNAAYIERQTLAELTEEEFDKHLQMNVKVPLFTVKAAATHMKAGMPQTFSVRLRIHHLHSGGRVIFVSSSVTRLSNIGPSTLMYTATKEALEQLSRILTKDLGTKGITVNVIAPGPTTTDMFTNTWSQEFTEYVASLHPQKHMGLPKDIAPLVGFLASEEAGQAISANGVSAHHS